MGKLLPKKLGISIPVYASINQTVTTPEYDPYDLDVKLKDKLNAVTGKDKTAIKNAAQDKTTIKTLNFTNVRVMPGAKTRLWSISNFDLSYSYISYQQTSPVILKNDVIKHRGGLGYTFNKQPKYFEPFKKIIKSKSPWYALVRDFNLNPQPSLLSFRADVNRQFGEFVPRIVDTYDNKVQKVDTTFDKFFTFDRYYNMRWDLTRSLNVDFSAVNNARIDEPQGAIDTKAKKDTIRTNFFKGGRNTLYQQRAIASYTFPLSKLPLTDWVNARYSYTTTYNWIGASRLAISLGNTIENSQENNLTGEFDFTRLYAKSRWLKALDQAPPQSNNPGQNKKGQPAANPTTNPTAKTAPAVAASTLPSRDEVIKGLSGKPKKVALRKWRKQKRDERKAARLLKAGQPVEIPGIARAGGQLLTMVKRASVNFGESFRTRIPGYMDSTRALGQTLAVCSLVLTLFLAGSPTQTGSIKRRLVVSFHVIQRLTSCSGKASIKS